MDIAFTAADAFAVFTLAEGAYVLVFGIFCILTSYPSNLFDFCHRNLTFNNQKRLNSNRIISKQDFIKALSFKPIKIKYIRRTELDKLPIDELVKWGDAHSVKNAKYLGR